MRTQPKVGRTDAATLWACDSRGWVRSSLLASPTLLVQILQEPLLKDLNTVVDSQSPGAEVSGKGHFCVYVYLGWALTIYLQKPCQQTQHAKRCSHLLRSFVQTRSLRRRNLFNSSLQQWHSARSLLFSVFQWMSCYWSVMNASLIIVCTCVYLLSAVCLWSLRFLTFCILLANKWFIVKYIT